jgi:opacity protein-like surface antigen
MSFRISAVLVGFFMSITLWAGRVEAQVVEASVSIGYSASSGIESDRAPLLGQLYDEAAVTSGASFNFTVGGLFGEHAGVEFLFARQNSRLDAEGPGGSLPVSELAVYQYMGNFVYNWGDPDARVRPYASLGLGATNYSFGALLLPNARGDIGSETQFATTWGGGVKFYFTPKVGVKVGLRWTPTYIKSDPAGLWCDPFYGCWELVDPKYSHQFETAGGLTFRF